MEQTRQYSGTISFRNHRGKTTTPVTLKAEVLFEVKGGHIVSTATIQGGLTSTLRVASKNTTLPSEDQLWHTAHEQLTTLINLGRHVIVTNIVIKFEIG